LTQTPQTKEFHLHLVSDATGETINSVARACVSQFDQVAPVEHFWNLVRTERQLEMVIDYAAVCRRPAARSARPACPCWTI
jgi:[pyruvate, water dikinase]-phosphate phosphotransferase / [pyruvate, water dikinase] kinase